MRTFRDHLQEKLRDKGFRDIFDEEKELVRIGIEVVEARAKHGMSRADLAKRANLKLQQVSKVENGENYNVLTLLKVCRALSLRCRLYAST